MQEKKKYYEAQNELLEAELEKKKLLKVELENEIEFKNKSMTSYKINFIQKAQLIRTLQEEIRRLQSEIPANIKGDFIELRDQVDGLMNLKNEWLGFFHYFENVYPGLLGKLKERHALTEAELKLAAVVRLNMNVKESAAILGNSADSTKKARQRLRKKMDLDAEVDLLGYLVDIEKDKEGK